MSLKSLYRFSRARNPVIAVLGVSLWAVLAFGQGGAPEKYPPLDLKAGAHITEQAFCLDYLDWIAFRADLGNLEASYGRRLEEARFAIRQHLAYLEEQPFLATVADAYRAFLKDLDTVQERVERWKTLEGEGGSPDYSEAVEGFVRKTVYDEGAAISPDALESNYFAQRMRADDQLPKMEQVRDRTGILACYDLYYAAATSVPPGKAYDAFRIDVLRKAVASGRQVFVLGGDKPERSFAQSVNPKDARNFVGLCMALRELSPADPEGELKAAAAIGKWGAGDLRGAYDEALPVLKLRRTDGAFAVFCARLASANGHAAEAITGLAQALRGDLRDLPSATLLRVNPDFAITRKNEAAAFANLVSRVETLENFEAIVQAARALKADGDALEACKEIHGRIAATESVALQTEMLAATILGLRAHGLDAGVGELEARFETLSATPELRAMLGDKALKDSCPTCNGSGLDLALNRQCAKCSGTGVCGFEYCRKGIRFSPFDRGIGGRPPVRPKCGDCKGSGVCRYCKGKGKVFCPACEGEGRTYSKARIEAQLRIVGGQMGALALKERAAYHERVRLLPLK